MPTLTKTNHYHSCPECYEKWPCDLKCSIEPDLEDPVCHPGKEFGAHCICNGCEPFNPTQEWWDKYHGIKRSK